jgi:frataxin-like iron-binding protein CyaY
VYSELSTDRYHKLSDEVLEFICAKLEELADEIDMKGFDVEYNVCVILSNHLYSDIKLNYFI